MQKVLECFLSFFVKYGNFFGVSYITLYIGEYSNKSVRVDEWEDLIYDGKKYEKNDDVYRNRFVDGIVI